VKRGRTAPAIGRMSGITATLKHPDASAYPAISNLDCSHRGAQCDW
jgi:hypothetical protein